MAGCGVGHISGQLCAIRWWFVDVCLARYAGWSAQSGDRWQVSVVGSRCVLISWTAPSVIYSLISAFSDRQLSAVPCQFAVPPPSELGRGTVPRVVTKAVRVHSLHPELYLPPISYSRVGRFFLAALVDFVDGNFETVYLHRCLVNCLCLSAFSSRHCFSLEIVRRMYSFCCIFGSIKF